MHRCQVKVREEHSKSRFLLDCGDVAGKKIGKIWICDYHYRRFGIPERGEDVFANCDGAVDADLSNKE